MKSQREVRLPSAAGLFYAGTPDELRAQIEECFVHRLGPGLPSAEATAKNPLLGLVCPHAGYVYSGPVAAHGFSRLAGHTPDVVVILGPNHHGLGASVAVSAVRAWRTPFGDVPVDDEVSRLVLSLFAEARPDNLAHSVEHSIEVQLPFLQYLYGSEFSLVAIAMADQSWATSHALGDAIGTALESKTGLIIASSDLSHYETHRRAVEMDSLALEAVLALDPARAYRIVRQRAFSVCGLGPISAALCACQKAAATRAELLCYATSGDTSGDYSRVVGYASVAIS